MAKVLRIHNGAANTIGNWDSSTKIGTRAIASIPDPIGANDQFEITSIPSPFARMDLAKRAFKIVAESSLDGNTAYHKLVSDCLDVGQIFFNIEKYRDKIEIIVWDKDKCLNDLSQSALAEHKRLSNTYRTYLQQDGDEYNFDKMDCIYLLNYIDSSASNIINIIGATSPATLFFTSANNLQYVGEKIKFGNDKPFDAAYQPLYKRDFEYVKYWWSLKNSRPDFARLFPEVDLYLVETFKYLTDEQRALLRQEIVDASYYTDNYEDISVVSTAQQYVMLLDQKLRRKCSVTQVDSGFEMNVSKSLCQGKIPLALPVEMYTEPTFYVLSKWDKNTYVPYVDARPIYERTLPDDGTKYPYVTIGDFLEDTIVKVPYKLNSDAFFNGNAAEEDSECSFLLPLKKTFFNYFTAKDLQVNVAGKKRIELRCLSGGAVKVTLRIPIKAGGYVQYERIYYKETKADAANNKGTILEKEFTLGLYPNTKYADSVKSYYRIAFLDRDSVDNPDTTYALSFFDDENKQVEIESVVRRNRNIDGSRYDSSYIDSITYALENDFQYISLSDDANSDIHGVIIPKFMVRNGSKRFRFAIDFGTTNTHVEYSVDGDPSKPFDITEKDLQFQKLHLTDDYMINEVFNNDFIPSTIGGDSLYGYPMRTVISECNNTNWNKAVTSMANVNIPYTYEKNLSLPYNILHTDLKWSIKEEDKMRASKYIESLLLMLRTKVLLNNGDLSKTEIVWFYPASMTQNRYNKFKNEWEQTFMNLFGAPKQNIIAVSESVAPYYYHKAKKGATSTVVSVDIGGGTSDVLIVDKGTPIYLTSFRFAANTIFGDGYSYDAESNGFVNKYKDEIMGQLETNSLRGLTNVLKSMVDKRNSVDIIAFLFSLANNKEIKKQKIVIDFGKKLADDNRGKYVVILFYVAIFYHIAKLMKAKGLAMPRHITFSGNGSKVLNILSTNDDTLVRLTKIIFEEIYDSPYSIDGLDIIRPENSKESTCKGGILLNPFKSQDYSEIKDMKTVLVGTDNDRFADNELAYANIGHADLDNVEKEVRDFINFTFALDKKFSFYDNFDADRSILQNVKDLCQRDIRSYLENGISIIKEEIAQDGGDDKVEETLFFYPLVGVLNALVRNIYQM